VRDFQMEPALVAISGIVLDKKDVPIAGALVVANVPPFVLTPDSPVLSPVAGTTDAGGKFTIEGLPAGDVSFVAFAPGYVQQEDLSPLKVGDNELLSFNLSPAPRISVAVQNSRGEPVPAAVATAPGYFKIAAADDKGVIEFSAPVEMGPIDCTVAAEGYQSNSLSLDPKAPPATIVLDDKPVLSGKVTGESGEAIEGAQVSVFGTGGTQGKFDGATVTDKMGRFSLALSYPPVREVRVSRTGYFDQRVPLDQETPAQPAVTIRLKRVEAAIYGRVIDYRGIPVRRFVIHLRNVEVQPGGPEFQRSYNTLNGRYMISDVAPGVYSLLVQSVTESTAEDVQVVRMEPLEIRKGFLFGEVLAQFPKPKYVK
jgi:hypothetical protein